MANKYQTLSEFLVKPFGSPETITKDQSFNAKYITLLQKNGIKIKAVTEVENSWFYHITIASESNEGYTYDVVIRFFTDNPLYLKEVSLRNYYVQFFSNAPSFMYTFAYVYKQNGFLIEALYDKLDPDYIDTPPEKTNATMHASYDKSIYCACRYLEELKFRYLHKTGPITLKKIKSNKFFSNISDFRSVKMDQTIMNEEKKLSKTLNTKTDKVKSGHKNANKHTGTRNSITIVSKKVGGHRVSKKVATKSTTRK